MGTDEYPAANKAYFDSIAHKYDDLHNAKEFGERFACPETLHDTSMQ